MALWVRFSFMLLMTVMVNFVLAAEIKPDISATIECGKTDTTQGSRFKRIAGGHDAKFGDHPWQAAIFLSTSKKTIFSCGGAILTDRWIITAATCVLGRQKEQLTIRLGEFDMSNENEPLRAEEYKVEKIEISPDYTHAKPYENDAALLKLDRLIKFDKHIIPVCLPSENFNPVGQIATVTGWGYGRSDLRETIKDVLREVDVEVFSNEQCSKWLSEFEIKRPLSESELCAGHAEGGKDACKGDSGGPLTTLIDGRRILIGIVSWGYDCGQRHAPGVYGNVNHFLPWIKNVTKN